MKNLQLLSHFYRQQIVAIANSHSTMHLQNQRTDIRFIQELLVHNSTKNTQRYTHVSQRMLKRIESPIDRILNLNVDYQHVRNK
jgi:site-specific recombinase XerD